MNHILPRKSLFLFIPIFLLIVNGISFGQEINAVVSCCEGEMGRCTGSAYCTACKTCNYCKHCNNGGSCGVCSGGVKRATTNSYTDRKNNSYPRSTSRRSSNKSKKANTFSTEISSNSTTVKNSGIYYLPDDIFSKYYLKTLMVNTMGLNLRAGPGTKYVVLEKLTQYQELVFMAMTGNWVKVKVKSTKTIGFVHYKYVVVLTE